MDNLLMLLALAGSGVAAWWYFTHTAHAAGAIELSVLSINPNPSNPGQAVTISCVATNTGTAQQSRTVTLAVGGSTVDSQEVTLAGKESTNVSFQITAVLGVHSVSLEDLAGTLSVVETPVANIVLSNFTVAPNPCNQGDMVTVSVTATNTGSAEGSRTITLTVT